MNRGFCQVLIVSVAAALLSGCGGSQPPIGGPGVTPLLAYLDVVSDPSFEEPVINPGSYKGFAPHSKIGPWKVVGSGGEVGLISTTYSDAGYAFTAGCDEQSVDLAAGGTKDGLSQKLHTSIGKHTLSFMVGNISSSNTYLGKKSTVIAFVDGSEILKATNSRGAGVKHLVWMKFSTTFKAKSTSTTITFKSDDLASDVVDELDCIAVK